MVTSRRHLYAFGFRKIPAQKLGFHLKSNPGQALHFGQDLMMKLGGLALESFLIAGPQMMRA
jgi:hypothetical protein